MEVPPIDQAELNKQVVRILKSELGIIGRKVKSIQPR
jgi:hypothetical protein